jgi:hypothetical protein
MILTIVRIAAWACLAACVGWFCVAFNAGDPSRHQILVDGLWLLALVLWSVQISAFTAGTCTSVGTIQRANTPLNPPLARGEEKGGWWPIVALLTIFAVAWLPFYDNWRWAFTGDSIAWFGPAYSAATEGLNQNILSLKGPDNNFTYLHSLAFNVPMFLFGPTLFWHRVGKLIVSCVSLATIYTFFRIHLGRGWAVAIVACLATNYVFLWFSYVSYPQVDSFIFAYLILILATFIWRDPDAIPAWLMLGLIAGFSLFFTQTAWATVTAAGAVLGVRTLCSGRYRPVAVCAATFLLVGIPVFLQWPALMDMTTRQAASIYEPGYLRRIFTAIIMQPYHSGIFGLGVNGAFLRMPLGHLYLAGFALAVLSLVGPVRRLLRIPPITPVLFLLLLWESLLMTLTNNAYGDPSTKRTYHLLPLQIFLALVPACALMAWVRRWVTPRILLAAIVCAVITIYAANNLQMVVHPAPAMYGDNEFDGLIELRQRHSDRRVVFFTSRAEMTEWVLSPKGFYAQAYHLPDTIAVELEFSPEKLRAACRESAIICHAPYTDRDRFDRMVAETGLRLTPIPVLNSRVLSCFTSQAR